MHDLGAYAAMHACLQRRVTHC